MVVRTQSKFTLVKKLWAESLMLAFRLCIFPCLLLMQISLNLLLRKSRRNRYHHEHIHSEDTCSYVYDEGADYEAAEAYDQSEYHNKIAYLCTAHPVRQDKAHANNCSSALESELSVDSVDAADLANNLGLSTGGKLMLDALGNMMAKATPKNNLRMDWFMTKTSKFTHRIFLAMVLYPMIVIAQALSLQRFLGAVTDIVEHILSWALGITPINNSPVTLVNLTSPDFSLPYETVNNVKFAPISASKEKETKKSLSGKSHKFDYKIPHLLSMCAKLSYEREELVKTKVRDWGFDEFKVKDPETGKVIEKTCVKLFQTDSPTANPIYGMLVPDTYCFVIKTGSTMIVIFRGTTPTNLLQVATDVQLQQMPLRTSKRTNKAQPKGFSPDSEVHEGFFLALTHTLRETLTDFDMETMDDVETKVSAFARFVMLSFPTFGVAEERAVFNQEAIQDSLEDELGAHLDTYGDKARIYVTGHSLGAALSSVFVSLLPDDLAECVHRGGVCTFGQPLTGNPAYARAYDAKYGKSTIRVVNATDIVTKIPWKIDNYEHHESKWLITTVGEVLQQTKDGRQSVVSAQYFEDNCWAFTLFFKLRCRDLTTAAKLQRLMLVPARGTWLSDHAPHEYEVGMRGFALDNPRLPSELPATPRAKAVLGASVIAAGMATVLTGFVLSSGRKKEEKNTVVVNEEEKGNEEKEGNSVEGSTDANRAAEKRKEGRISGVSGDTGNVLQERNSSVKSA